MSTETLDNIKANLPVHGFLKFKDLQIPQGDDLVKAILELKKEKERPLFFFFVIDKVTETTLK